MGSERRARVSKIIVSEYLTLDGVMEAPEEWQFPYYSDDVAEFNKVQILALDALLLGRVTYEIFAAHWPNQTNNEFGVADKLNAMPKYVVSSRLKKAEWNNSTLIKGDVVEAVARLKQQPGGDISLMGSASLAQSLMEADLIDEYRLQVYPIVLGKGLRLFKDGMKRLNLKLVESIAFKSGAVSLVYRQIEP
jgi:dihydrofolate reductase